MLEAKGRSFVFGVRELNGATGDLGTLLPLTLGAIAVGSLAPTPVLLGFAIFYIATAFHYRLPVPVQPMKAVAAVLLTAGMTPAEVAISGVLIGLVLVIAGATGWITRLAHLVPRSVLAGLQLGLGLALAALSLELMASAPAVAAACLAIVLSTILLAPRVPGALIALLVATVLAPMVGATGMHFEPSSASAASGLAIPSAGEIQRALSHFVLPQLSLTFTNAVVLTALVAGDYFGERAAQVTPTRLSITSGLANLALAPFGALPMCHGAGGLAAHYRFGARSGSAPLIIGLTLLALACLPNGLGLAALAAIPIAGLGALLLVAAGELALSKRLFDCKPSCWPVIAATAVLTVYIDPFWGLAAGLGAECVRVTVVRAFATRFDRQ